MMLGTHKLGSHQTIGVKKEEEALLLGTDLHAIGELVSTGKVRMWMQLIINPFDIAAFNSCVNANLSADFQPTTFTDGGQTLQRR